jgi:hypothetical protein
MKCPHCGKDIDEQPVYKLFKNSMNVYVKKSDGTGEAIFNEIADEIQVGPEGNTETYIKSKLYKVAVPSTPIDILETNGKGYVEPKQFVAPKTAPQPK